MEYNKVLHDLAALCPDHFCWVTTRSKNSDNREAFLISVGEMNDILRVNSREDIDLNEHEIIKLFNGVVLSSLALNCRVLQWQEENSSTRIYKARVWRPSAAAQRKGEMSGRTQLHALYQAYKHCMEMDK